MRVTVNDELKIIQFWLSGDDEFEDLLSHTDSIAKNLLPDKNYKKIIYHSGTVSLKDVACDLFRHNLRVPVKQTDTAQIKKV